MLLDDMGGSRVRSRARSRIGSHDHRSHDHGVIKKHLIFKKKKIFEPAYYRLPIKIWQNCIIDSAE